MNPLFKTSTPILDQGTPEAMRGELLNYFNKTFDLDEQLYSVLATKDAYLMRADSLRHPLIFYYGHTAVFYVNKLLLAGIIKERIDPEIESIFAVGVDEMSWDDLNMSNYNWPEVDVVKNYRKQVRDMLCGLIQSLPLEIPVSWESNMWLVLMGIEHQRIHIETSSVLIRQLPLNFLKPIDGWNRCLDANSAPSNNLIPIKGDKVILGKPYDSPLYGWDNEYGEKVTVVDDFLTSAFLCSNGEFKKFVDAGGYSNHEYWTDEGWQWRNYENAVHPRFWEQAGDEWKLRLIFETIQMPWDWPVEVNYLEAKAFCNWKAEQIGQLVRLPSEEEWHHLLNLADVPDQPLWGVAPGNINMEHFQSPCPVNKFAFGGLYDIVGNVWQWTETPIDGFNGFRIHPYYDDFSTPTFDTRHNIIKGGSWISTGNEATQAARYAFRRHFYQHAGFRYVVAEKELEIANDIIETDKDITPYCEAQFGEGVALIPNYRKSIAELALAVTKGRVVKSAIDIGCKVGRTTWELARGVDKVVGIDFTARYIRVPVELASKGWLRYQFDTEGELNELRVVKLEEYGFTELNNRVEFWQADASNLKPGFKDYDLVILNDIITELYDPINLLNELPSRINDKGFLIVATDYNWDNKLTPAEKQIGGKRDLGEPLWGFQHLSSILKSKFSLITGPEKMYDYIPQNNRVGKLKHLEVTVWQKK